MDKPKNSITFKAPPQMVEEIHQMALTMGYVDEFSGEPNVSAYMRSCHRLMQHQYEQGLVKPGGVNYRPDDLRDEDVA